MNKKLLCVLVAAGIFGAMPAHATTAITSSEVQTFAGYVVNYLSSNNIPELTATDLQMAQSMYQSVVNAPAGDMSSWVNTVNSVLQSSAGCSGMGVYPNYSIDQMSACSMDVSHALMNAGYTSEGALLTAGIGIAKAAGVPLTIPGTSVTIPQNTPPTSTPATQISRTVTETISTAVTPQIQRATSVQQATVISNVLSNIFSGRAPTAPRAPARVSLGNEKGMAAGGSPAKLNAWVNASDTTIGNSAAGSMFDGTVTNALGGIDYRVSDRFVAGVSVGYDRVDLDFKFLANSGMLSEGWLVAPYASYQVSDIISVDGAYGYANGDVDTRASGATSSQSYDRNFLALNMNANYWMGDWQLTGKANYIFAEEKMDTTNKMEQMRLGGQVGYWREGIMPYAGIAYVRDLKATSSAPGGMPSAMDKDAWVGSVGVNFFSKGAFSAGISYTEEFDRDDTENYTFMANVGYRF
jgi:hypothetical protein